ncbi:D-glycero-beta-D-manno-heptose-7-phosphate kinase [Schlesneria paludicola]|uniref:D-glycero-beta-D-manno-heptose-7-phosphate kinase n=1 Tax=Schlesneria paludicola TaxID=360056 RepID=UPI00029B4478|nr:D-glycero-beta-D-manno-heptose-7-phosphate kinase [Schlesneria paludicola]
MQRPDELAALVPKLQTAQVTCVGDVMLDRFVYGDVSRISPEAPVPVVLVKQELVVLGGLGNVARNLSTLGANASVISVVGQDEGGREIRHLLNELPNCAPDIIEIPQHTSTIKTRCIASSQQIVRIDREAQLCLSEKAVDDLVARTIDKPETPVLVLSDYGKGVLSGQNAQQIIVAARQAGQFVIVDPKGTDYSRYRGANLIKPNRLELCQATGRTVNSNVEIIAACRELIEKFDLGAVIATLSERGMMVVTKNGPAIHLPSEAREVFDVSGAGDTVIATLAAAIAVGIPLADAAYMANRAAAVVVAKVGTATISAAELVRALRVEDVSQAEEKIVTATNALERVRSWQRMGERVGFTNGCFDLLHPGHVTLLAQSAAKVDRLIVGLNSDDSVKRLKGPTRPIQNEMSRSIVLAALSSVDLVVIFNEDTPLEIIQQLRPDVLIKGADYTVSTVVGAEFVQSYGGEVALIDLVPQQSTTRLVKQIHAA